MQPVFVIISLVTRTENYCKVQFLPFQTLVPLSGKTFFFFGSKIQQKYKHSWIFFLTYIYKESIIIEDSPINDVKIWNVENKHKHAKNHNILQSYLYNNI